jgi:Uma2 family endonuclease
MTVDIARWQFTVADYSRMREAGILSEDDRVELLDGEVRPMSPIGPFHAAIVNLLVMLLTRHLGDRAIVSVQNPIQLNDYSEPQPDVAILQPRQDFYAAAHPRPDDILIAIEVADSSLEYDRAEKLPRYAEAGITEVWIVDIGNQTVEQYTQPRNGRYHQLRLVEHGEDVIAQAIDQLVLAVDALFR